MDKVNLDIELGVSGNFEPETTKDPEASSDRVTWCRVYLDAKKSAF